MPKIPEKLPFLKAICWQTDNVKHFTPEEMLARYERGWHYLGVLGQPTKLELLFIKKLAKVYGSWLISDFSPMFKLEWHQNILTILESLNADFFTKIRAYFGGGTLVSLKHGEHRLSKDIDFICPLGEGYRLLRSQIADYGYKALFTSFEDINLPKNIQADRYGVRFPVMLNETAIKFEIVIEERIQLGEPEYQSWSSIPCLNETDSVAEKLLANSDRWNDSSVQSRDLIDLAVQRLDFRFSTEAIDKAEKVYPVISPLKKAILYFQSHPYYREKCFQSLQVTSPKKIIDGLDLLALDFGLELTERIKSEDSLDDKRF